METHFVPIFKFKFYGKCHTTYVNVAQIVTLGTVSLIPPFVVSKNLKILCFLGFKNIQEIFSKSKDAKLERKHWKGAELPPVFNSKLQSGWFRR